MEGTPGALIGRDDVLATLAAAVRDDRPIAIVGEAGIGKTSLVRAGIAAAGRVAREGGGFATLSWLPYLALRRAIGVADLGDPGTAAGIVEGHVGPDVLFVDDLQWTDPDTQAALGLLVGRVGLVVAVRDGDEGSPATLARLQDWGMECIRLAGLDRASASLLAARARPGLTAGAISAIVDRSGGNPLLVEELAARGESSSSLARAITAQVRDLPPLERDVLRLLALAGRPILVGALRAGERSAATALAGRSLLREAADGLEIRHALIAEAIVAEIDPETQRALHGRLAAILPDPAERASHQAAAGDRAAAHATARAALQGRLDPRTRAALLRIAAQTADAEAGELRVRAAMQLSSVGNFAAAAELLAEPVEGSDDLRALAAATVAGALSNDGRHDEAWAAIEAGQDLRPDPTSDGAIELGVTRATALVNLGRLAEGVAAVDATRAAAGTAGGYRLAGHVAALHLYNGEFDHLDALGASLASAIAAGDGGNASGRAMDLYYLTLAIRGGPAGWAFAQATADEIDALGYHVRATELRAEAMQAVIFAGELRAAVIEIDSLLEAPLGRLSRQRLGYNRGLAMALLGHVDEAERTLSDTFAGATPDYDGRGSTLWCWAEASYLAGFPARAVQQVDDSFAYTAYNDAELVLPSLVRAWAEVELGRPPRPLAYDVPFRLVAGAMPESRALAAWAAGEHAAARDGFDEAAGLWADHHVPKELLCAWGAADAARQAGDPSALARLDTVLARASAIGFEPLAARARRSIRLAGGRAVAPQVAGTEARAGDGLLTRREREILGLVERGLTNAEIARRMSLGRPTVARLLSNAMLKLGAESRAQAVVLAAQAT